MSNDEKFYDNNKKTIAIIKIHAKVVSIKINNFYVLFRKNDDVVAKSTLIIFNRKGLLWVIFQMLFTKIVKIIAMQTKVWDAI